MWPTMKPWEPPEKRPSVMRATSEPSPAPMMADVGVSISGMPGPPFGAFVADDDHVPLFDLLCSRAWSMSSSESKTLAGPPKRSPSFSGDFRDGAFAVRDCRAGSGCGRSS